MNAIKNISRLLELFRPYVAKAECLHCQNSLPAADWLCRTCLEKITPLSKSCCTLCALPLASSQLSPHRCAECVLAPPSFQQVKAAFIFGDVLQRALHRLKFSRDLSVVSSLVTLASPAFYEICEEFAPDYIVPMPLSFWRKLQRTFNQSHVLTRSLSQSVKRKIPLFEEISRRHHKAQAQKSRLVRLQSLRGVFKVLKPEMILQKKILIVDDVMTTGASLEALSATLKRAGAGEIRAFVLARVAKRENASLISN